jgi:predicted CXXCH cytochrome family protein
MKKHIVVVLAIGLLLALGTVAMAGVTPGTGIQGTAHDLSSGGAGAAYGGDAALDRICIYCHTPHHSMTAAEATAKSVNYYPLWNHDVTVQSFQSYTNGLGSGITNTQHALNADQTGGPGTVSILCLSCHDGSVATAAYGNMGNNLNPTKNAGALTVAGTQYQVGASGNLSNHHPIGFDYAAVVALDDEINDPSTGLRGANPNGLTIGDLLWGGTRMECSSCHDVHNTKNEGDKFTWVQDTQSDLCLTCHNK